MNHTFAAQTVYSFALENISCSEAIIYVLNGFQNIWYVPFARCDFGSNMSDCPLVTQSSEQLWCQDIVRVIAQLVKSLHVLKYLGIVCVWSLMGLTHLMLCWYCCGHCWYWWGHCTTRATSCVELFGYCGGWYFVMGIGYCGLLYWWILPTWCCWYCEGYSYCCRG